MKKITIMALFIGLWSGIFGQRFTHQIGLSLLTNWELPYSYTAVYSNRSPVAVVTPKDYLSFVALHYHPAFRAWASPNQRFHASAGVPISTSFFFGASTSQGTSPKNFIVLSLPLQLELGIGARSQQDGRHLGAFVAAGAGLQMMHTRSQFYYSQPLRFRQFNSYLSVGLRGRVAGRLFQASLARSHPFRKREPLGEVAALPGQTEIEFPREILRAAHIFSLSMFLGKSTEKN